MGEDAVRGELKRAREGYRAAPLVIYLTKLSSRVKKGLASDSRLGGKDP